MFLINLMHFSFWGVDHRYCHHVARADGHQCVDEEEDSIRFNEDLSDFAIIRTEVTEEEEWNKDESQNREQ